MIPFAIIGLLACLGAFVAVNLWRRDQPTTPGLLSSLMTLAAALAVAGAVFALREPYGLLLALPSWSGAFTAWQRYSRLTRIEKLNNRTKSTYNMDEQEALAVLGLDKGANPDSIKAAHKRIIGQIHPDQGGSDYLAAKANQARDVLLG